MDHGMSYGHILFSLFVASRICLVVPFDYAITAKAVTQL